MEKGVMGVIAAGCVAVVLAVGHQAGVIFKTGGRAVSHDAPGIGKGLSDDFTRGTDDLSRGADDVGRSSDETSLEEQLADIAQEYGQEVAEECAQAIDRGEGCELIPYP